MERTPAPWDECFILYFDRQPAAYRKLCGTDGLSYCGMGRVHSAEDWDELLLPEIERQQDECKEKAGPRGPAHC